MNLSNSWKEHEAFCRKRKYINMLIPEKLKMMLNKANNEIYEMTGNISTHQHGNNYLLQFLLLSIISRQWLWKQMINWNWKN